MNNAACQQATGDNTDAVAYSEVAVERLSSIDLSHTYERPYFQACTGAITDDVIRQIEAMRADVPADLQLWDVVSVSVGGNNVAFADVVKRCLIAGCRPSLDDLQARVDSIFEGPGEPFIGTNTVPDVLDAIAKVVRPGGHVIVVGYPHFVEAPEYWSWLSRTAHVCKGFRAGDATMLRAATDHMNAALERAVNDATASHAAEGITFHFVDASAVYEPSSVGSERHGVCARGVEWINGPTGSLSSGDLRFQRSIHPNQLGHRATGNQVASVVATFTFPESPEVAVPTTDFDEGWPVGDFDGPPYYFTWLGASFFFPSWASCGPAVCIASDGATVLVTELDPLRDIGTISEDVDDPLAALVALGVSQADALAALAPVEG